MKNLLLIALLIFTTFAFAQKSYRYKTTNGEFVGLIIKEMTPDSAYVVRVYKGEGIHGWMQATELKDYALIYKGFLQNPLYPKLALKDVTYSPLYGIGVGAAVFNAETMEASKMGINLSFMIHNVYCGFSSNLAKGDGEYLEYYTSGTYELDKIQVSAINLGYSFQVTNTMYITPVLGYGWKRTIYQDEVGFDTYMYGDSKGSLNLGVNLIADLFSGGGVYAGLGLFERFNAGIWVKF
jgi:hypothetical protein